MELTRQRIHRESEGKTPRLGSGRRHFASGLVAVRKRAELLQVGYQVGCLGPIRHLESARLAVGEMHHSLRRRGS